MIKRTLAATAALLLSAPAVLADTQTEIKGYVNGVAAGAACFKQAGMITDSQVEYHFYKAVRDKYGFTDSQADSYLDKTLVANLITMFGGCDQLIRRITNKEPLL